MSMVEDHEPGLVEEPEPIEPGLALDSRMEARGDELARQTSEWFPLPGYDDILEVELKPLGWKTSSSIQHRNERVRDPGTRELYNMADQIIRATMGFRQVWPEDEEREPQPITDDWVSLAKRRRMCPENPTSRQALLFLLTDARVPQLFQDWILWTREVRKENDEEVGRDFSPTG